MTDDGDELLDDLLNTRANLLHASEIAPGEAERAAFSKAHDDFMARLPDDVRKGLFELERAQEDARFARQDAEEIAANNAEIEKLGIDFGEMDDAISTLFGLPQQPRAPLPSEIRRAEREVEEAKARTEQALEHDERADRLDRIFQPTSNPKLDKLFGGD